MWKSCPRFYSQPCTCTYQTTKPFPPKLGLKQRRENYVEHPPETISSKCCVSVILHYRVIPLSLGSADHFLYPTVTCGVPACDVFGWTSWFSSPIYSDIANRSRARGILTWRRDPISIRRVKKRSRFSIDDKKDFFLVLIDIKFKFLTFSV